MAKANHDLSRRALLGRAATGALALCVTPIVAQRSLAASGGGSSRPGKFVVIVNLVGGNDALNTVVPTGLGAAYRAQRPRLNLLDNLPAGAALHDLDGGSNAFHHSLAGLKGLWDDGDVHIVNHVSYPDPNMSHFTSRDIYSTGIRDVAVEGDGRGWLGRFADCYWSNPVDPLGVISVGLRKPRVLRATRGSPLVIRNVQQFEVAPDLAHPDDHALRLDLVRSILATDPAPTRPASAELFRLHGDAFPLVDRVQADTASWVDPGTYPTTNLGRNLRGIAQLFHAQQSWNTQVYYTGVGGYDTHSGQHSAMGGQNLHQSLLSQLDDALGAFVADLKAQGRWDDCCILLVSEFGRRNAENGSLGTDHGHGSTTLVLGGSVKGRTAPGGGLTSPHQEADLLADVLPFRLDFRDLYGHVVQTHLGLDPSPLFPDPQYVPNLASVDLVD